MRTRRRSHPVAGRRITQATSNCWILLLIRPACAGNLNLWSLNRVQFAHSALLLSPEANRPSAILAARAAYISHISPRSRSPKSSHTENTSNFGRLPPSSSMAAAGADGWDLRVAGGGNSPVSSVAPISADSEIHVWSTGEIAADYMYGGSGMNLSRKSL